MKSHETDLPPKAIALIQKGALLEAIKHTRSAHGLDLKDTKEFVGHYLERNPALKARYKVASTIERKRIVTKLATILAMVGAAVLVLLYALDNGP